MSATLGAPATRADVARESGTSVAVVSYVMNKGPRPVAPATRLRVLAAAAQLGYRPNGVARALAAGSTFTLGLVVPDISNEFFAELAFAVEGAARQAGRTVLIANSEGSVELEHELIETFLSRQIDGVIVASEDAEAAARQLTGSRTRAVFLGRCPAEGVFGCIAVDNHGGAAAATTHLLQHEHGLVAMIGGPEGAPVADARRDGWSTAMGGKGEFSSQPFTVEGGYLGGLDLLRRSTRPRAIFAASDRQAIGLLRAAADLGLSVPDDLAIVTFDGSAASAYSVPSLSTVAQPIKLMAALAVERLISTIDTRDERTLGVELVVRRSCGCHPPTLLAPPNLETTRAH